MVKNGVSENKTLPVKTDKFDGIQIIIHGTDTFIFYIQCLKFLLTKTD